MLISFSLIWFVWRYAVTAWGAQTIVRVGAFVMLALSLFICIDFILGSDSPLLHPLAVGIAAPARISPVTAICLALAALAFLVLVDTRLGQRARELAVGLWLGVFLIGMIMLIGYLYGAPLLYGSTITPVSSGTTLGLVFLSSGFILSAGPAYWPLRSFVGDSLQARLVRMFVPVASGLTLLYSAISTLLIAWLDNLPLSIAAALVIELGVVVGVVLRMARQIGGEFDRNTASRERAEQALRASEEQYRRLVMNLQEGIGVIDPEARITFANPRLAEIVGAPVAEVEGKALAAFLDPAGREKMERKLKRCALGIQDEFELEFLRIDGGSCYTSLGIAPLFDERGNYHGALIAVTDISRRWRSEHALRERLKEMTCLYSVRRDMQEPLALDELCARIGEHLVAAMQFPEISAALIEVEGRRFATPAYRPELARCISADIRLAGQICGSVQVYYTENRPFILPEEQEMLDAVADHLGLWLDRNQKDEALQRALKQLNLHLANSPLAVVEADERFRIIRWTGAAQATFGWTAKEMLGLRLDEPGWIHPEDHLEVERIMAAMQSGQNFSNVNRNRNLRKDGTTVECEWYNTSIYDSAGNLVSVLSQALDVTERNRAEAELERSQAQLRALAGYLQAVREEERTFMAREIHDELGQSLTALKMDLAWIAKRLTPDHGQPAEKVADMLTLVDGMIQTVRRMATELRPGMLDDLGLVAALEWQAQEFSRRTGVQTRLDLAEELPPLAPAAVTALFRIFQETLTNITRHADASQVNVRLDCTFDQVYMRIQDNGRGIQPDEINNPRSLGLVGMRERAGMVGGTLAIQGGPDVGTTIMVSVPFARREDD